MNNKLIPFILLLLCISLLSCSAIPTRTSELGNDNTAEQTDPVTNSTSDKAIFRLNGESNMFIAAVNSSAPNVGTADEKGFHYSINGSSIGYINDKDGRVCATNTDTKSKLCTKERIYETNFAKKVNNDSHQEMIPVAISPDGTIVAYSLGRHAYSGNILGTLVIQSLEGDQPILTTFENYDTTSVNQDLFGLNIGTYSTFFKAQFSPDGNYLAVVLDLTDSRSRDRYTSMLYIVDTQTWETINQKGGEPSEDFIWYGNHNIAVTVDTNENMGKDTGKILWGDAATGDFYNFTIVNISNYCPGRVTVAPAYNPDSQSIVAFCYGQDYRYLLSVDMATSQISHAIYPYQVEGLIYYNHQLWIEVIADFDGDSFPSLAILPFTDSFVADK